MTRKRFKPSGSAACLILLLGTSLLLAGNTGKIAGVITDAANRQPLIGTNVQIQGTALGAATDMKGQYSILNIPPGIYTLKITMMGYKTLVIENVRVSIDLTTAIIRTLEPTVLDAAETVTVVAERPMVQADMTSSLSTVGADEIEKLPVQSMADVLELQAGVIRDGGDFHIRGGRAGEVAYWVDGVATTESFSGGNAVPVEKNAIQELQVVSGTFNAEYGQAMSGIVNIITKEGGGKTVGEVNAYVGDYLSGHDVYSVLKKVETETDPATGLTRAAEDKENPLRGFNPVLNTDLTLSGPVPFAGGRLNYFFNGRYFSDESYLYGRRWFYPQGVPGDSDLVSLNAYQSYSGLAKLTLRATSNLKLNYSLYLNQWHKDRSGWNQSYKYNPDGIPQNGGTGQTHILAWNHVLSSNTFYEARVSRVYQDYESYVYEDPELIPHYMVNVTGDTVSPYVLDLGTEAGRQQFETVKQLGIAHNFFINPENPSGYVHPDSAYDPAGYGFLRAGMSHDHYCRSSAYWIGKLDFTSQVSQVHQLKAGFEFRRDEVSLNSFSIQAKRVAGRDEAVTPYEPWVPPNTNFFHDQYTRNPYQMSAYAQDKIELRDMIVNIGLRYDYFNANHVVPTDPKDPSALDPMLEKNIYRNPGDPQPVEWSAAERREFMYRKVDGKMQLSPRLGIAYPITDRGTIHFSYGHFFATPQYQYLYDSPDFKMVAGGGRTIVGNADLNTEKTVQYEIWLQQQLSDNIGVDITLFYRDVRDWVGTSPLITTYKPAYSYSKYENKDYENVRGITVDLSKRFSGHYSAQVSYLFQVAEGSYSNATDAFYALQNLREPQLALIPMGWDQRHTLNAYLTLELSGYMITVMGQYRTGRPYTPSYARGTMVGSSNYSGLRDNSARLPATSGIDLLIQKGFRVGALNLAVFATVYNVFDQKGEVGVYSDTGTARYSSNIDPEYIGYNAARIGTVTDYVRQPTWYISPRQIQAGMKIGF